MFGSFAVGAGVASDDFEWSGDEGKLVKVLEVFALEFAMVRPGTLVLTYDSSGT